MAFGLHNLTNMTQNATTSTGIAVNQTSRDIYQFAASDFAGKLPILGLVLLGVIAFILFRSGASMDVYLSVLTPATLFLAWADLLPFSTAIIYTSVIVIAGLFAWSFYKFAFR